MAGLYIPNIEMPSCCCDCPMFKVGLDGGKSYISCNAKLIVFGSEDYDWVGKARPNWCPIVRVEDHGDLIDRDVLMERFTPDEEYFTTDEEKEKFDECTMSIRVFRGNVRIEPTVIESDRKKQDGCC